MVYSEQQLDFPTISGQISNLLESEEDIVDGSLFAKSYVHSIARAATVEF